MSEYASEVFAVLDRLESDAAALAELSFDALSERDCEEVMGRLMTVARKVPGLQYELVNQLVERAVPADIGGPLARVIADRLLIRPSVADQGDLGPWLGSSCRGILACMARCSAVQEAAATLDREAAQRYVLSRRTPQGGYCFYRQEACGADCLTRYERTGYEYVQVRPLF